MLVGFSGDLPAKMVTWFTRVCWCTTITSFVFEISVVKSETANRCVKFVG